MRPAALTPDHFAAYPPRAREVAVRRIALLRQLPLSFVPLLLRELQAYDWKFPAERHEIDAQLTHLASLSPAALGETMRGFEAVALSPALEALDWVAAPGRFSEELSAHLWATGQLAPFREAATALLEAVRRAVPPPEPAVPRLAVALIGRGVAGAPHPLFRKLRPHGTYFTRVRPANGLRVILDRLAARAEAHPAPFAHWYVDGGSADAPGSTAVTVVAYRALEPVRAAVVRRMRDLLQMREASEAGRSALAALGPTDVGLAGADEDTRVVDRFTVSVLTQASGTQFFSTTFVQWSARELLRRAQPLTLLTRDAPRISERSLNAALAGLDTPPVLDREGSLTDADMGAYYTWLNLQRLPGAAASSFLAWYEDHAEAVLIAPATPRGTVSATPVGLDHLLDEAQG